MAKHLRSIGGKPFVGVVEQLRRERLQPGPTLVRPARPVIARTVIAPGRTSAARAPAIASATWRGKRADEASAACSRKRSVISSIVRVPIGW